MILIRTNQALEETKEKKSWRGMRINPHPSRITTRTKTKERKKMEEQYHNHQSQIAFHSWSMAQSMVTRYVKQLGKSKMGCTNKRRTVTAKDHTGCLARDGTLLFSRISSSLSKFCSPSPFTSSPFCSFIFKPFRAQGEVSHDRASHSWRDIPVHVREETEHACCALGRCG